MDAYIAYKHDGHLGSDWTAVTRDSLVYYRLIHDYGWTPVNKENHQKARPWTDGYSNIIPYFFRLEVLSSMFERWDIR